MSIVLGNFSFSSAYADLGHCWTPAQELEGHWSGRGRQVNRSVQQSMVVMTIVVKSPCYGDSVKEVPRKQRWHNGFIFPVDWYWLPAVQC